MGETKELKMKSRREKNRKMKKLAVLIRVFAISIFIGILLLFGIRIKTILQLNNKDEAVTADNKQKISEENQQVQIDENPAESEELTEELSVEEAAEPTEEELLKQHIENKLEDMTLEEKVAQMFFVTPEQLTGVSQVISAGDTTKNKLKEYPVGGIVYFAQNFIDPVQTKEMLTRTQEYAMETQEIPIFLGTDEEGGRVLRIAGNPKFPDKKVDAMGILAVQGEDAVYEGANDIGAYLKQYGINVDFAPDVDVLVNADNGVIGDRSFGSNPETVKDMAAVYTKALHENNILACYKHFPGHGGTVADSHTGTAVLDRTIEQLRENELVPFMDAKEQEVDFVMVSHISVPQVTGDDTPASLSKEMITKLLRNELGYNGIVITDSLQMGAINEHYSSDEAVIKAVEAGCDMILMPKEFGADYEALLSAVDSGEISEERIDESVYRILKAKYQLNK